MLTRIERLAREVRFLWQPVPVPGRPTHRTERHCRYLEASRPGLQASLGDSYAQEGLAELCHHSQLREEVSSYQHHGTKSIANDHSTIQAYYSKGCKPLKVATQPIARNLTGQGQFQIGILKKPTGTDDVANSGFQEANLNEGLIYGGIFLEDSADGCVSL
jgi:hypothetical protein